MHHKTISATSFVKLIKLPAILIISLFFCTCLAPNTHAASTVSAKDFGAVGNGIADDSDAIIQAINSDANTIIIPEGQYRITKQIRITKSNKTIIGEKATLFATADEYTSPTSALLSGITEGLVQVGSSVAGDTFTNNVTFKGVHLDVRASASNSAPFSRLVTVVKVTGVHFDSCTFTSDPSLTNTGLVSIDFFANYRDVSVTNSTIRMLHTKAKDDGGGLYFRAYWNSPVSDIVFANNTMYKPGGDEILWLEVNGQETMTNVEINGNRFYISDNRGVFGIATSALENQDKIKNVKFHDNELIHHGTNAAIMLRDTENFDLYDNDIYTNTTKLGSPVDINGVPTQLYTGAIFGSGSQILTDTVKVHDNRTLTLDSKLRVQGLATGSQPYHIYNNHHVTINAPTVSSVADHYGNLINNNIVINGDVTSVIATNQHNAQTQPKLVQNNHIQVNGAASSFLRRWRADLAAPVTYTGNTITTTKKKSNPNNDWLAASHLVNMWDFSMNGHPITIRDNTFINGSDTENDTSLELLTVANTGSNTVTSRKATTYPDFLWGIHTLKDTTPLSQTATICNNTIKGFRNITTHAGAPTINLTCN